MRNYFWHWLVVFSVGILFPMVSLAHPLDPILVEIIEADDGVDVEMRYPMAPRPGMTPLEVRFPYVCETLPVADEKRAGGMVRRRWRVQCGGETLAGRTITLEGLQERENDALIRVVLEGGETVQAVIGPDEPFWELPQERDRLEVGADYTRLGFEHILGGLDHLLFVLGLLMLVSTWRTLLATVTAFTVGHSITLCLAVLEFIAIPPRPTEVLIAASLVVLALELLRVRSGSASPLGRHPTWMAMAFGLLHGLGFAGALEQVGLPAGEIPLALLGFNVGIELGQLSFVVLMIALYGLWRLVPSKDIARPPLGLAAYAIGCLAFYWMLERAAPLF